MSRNPCDSCGDYTYCPKECQENIDWWKKEKPRLEKKRQEDQERFNNRQKWGMIMSKMRIIKSEDDRMIESREMIRSKMMESIDFTITIYEYEYGKLYARLKDAVECIATKRGVSLGEQIVYAKSACYFSALLITHLIDVNVEEAMLLALGSYIEQEARSNKKDQWRDESFNTLYKHLRDEVAEIKNSEGITIRLHNCMDACALSAMLALTLESY